MVAKRAVRDGATAIADWDNAHDCVDVVLGRTLLVKNNINAIMCVVPISYSCGAISHASLRDHEAGFLSQPRLEVCDCDRVMNVPTSMMARCPICARQAAKQYRERGQTAGDYSGEGQQEEPLIHEAGAGEVEVSGGHDRVELPIREARRGEMGN